MISREEKVNNTIETYCSTMGEENRFFQLKCDKCKGENVRENDNQDEEVIDADCRIDFMSIHKIRSEREREKERFHQS